MTDSSSEDEINEALKESADCSYLNDLLKPKFDSNSSSAESNRKLSDRNEDQPAEEDDFVRFLAQRLAGRLEGNIKIVEKKRKDRCAVESTGSGIRLFSGSPVVSELLDDIDDGYPPNKRKPSKETIVDYEGRASAAAVSADWVTDKRNTLHWKDNKKTRIFEANVVKKLPNGAIECSLVQ